MFISFLFFPAQHSLVTLCGIFMLRSDKASFAIWRSSETEGGDQGRKGPPYYFVSTYVFGVRGSPTRASGYHSPPICPFTQNLGRIGRAGRLGSKKFQNYLLVFLVCCIFGSPGRGGGGNSNIRPILGLRYNY